MRVIRGAVMVALLATPFRAFAQDPQREVRERLGGGGRPDTTTALALSAAFRSASERTLPAVVFISVEQRQQALARPDQIPPSLRDFFGGSQGPQPPQQGTGSGFIIDTRGHILTNNHVVADAARLSVRLVDGREYNARVVGADVSTDIAVIKIDPRPGETLPTAPLGESDNLRVGDWVLALGNPLGLDFSVTAGIVSAKGRQMPGANDALESFIQTDAAINPGNSGGPLIDLFGRVVGVNSAIFGSTRFVGYGFAVPISLARRVASDLLEFGYLRRPRVGLFVRAVQAVDAEINKLPEVRGALISSVEPGGPGEAAGLDAGDVVLSVNNERIRDDADLITRLASMRPGQQVSLGIAHQGKPATVTIKLGEFPRPPKAAEAAPPDSAPRHQQVLGFSVRDISQADARGQQFTGKGGVVVDEVPQYGAAYLAGIRSGFILLAVNDKPVNNAEDVRRIAQDIKPGSAVSLRFFNSGLTPPAPMVLNYRTREGR
jgi:serine protease Do